jgi:antirestriction protein ArdC
MAKQEDKQVGEGSTRIDVKHEVAQRLIEAMEQGGAPWQRPWSVQSGNALKPLNPTTQNGYRGINRILLALSGRSSNLWMTYQQAADKGWQVRKGEKGTMIVKVVEMFRERDASGGKANSPASSDQSHGAAADGSGGQAENEQRKALALRRYVVFNAEQIEGMPRVEEPEPLAFDPVEKAEAVIQAMKEQTGLMVIHSGDKACYVPRLDEVRLPPKRAFKTEYDYYATAHHEICHSSMAPHRLNRAEAYAKKWGDSAYALEELTAEIGAAILSSETGVARSPELAAAHLEDHAKYLRSWIKAIENDSMAIFTAAKNAEKISEYILGLEKQMTAIAPHREWIKEYERAPQVGYRR